MPLFGAHMSVAGGLHKALSSARELNCETVQLFTSSPSQWSVAAVAPDGTSPRGWKGRAVSEEDVAAFKKLLKQTKLKFPTAHDSYLINLGSPDDAIYGRSIEAFVCELERAEQLGLSYLVTHPGAHMGSGEEAGLARVVTAIDEIHHRCAGFKVKVLIEATAGQGSSLGHRFEHLAHILTHVADSKRLGVCIDTCHLFAAGYALAPREKYEATLQELDDLVGLKRVKLFHLNDSMKPLGSRVDRHEALGKGHIGIESFRYLVNDPRFSKHPMVLETPKESGENTKMDEVNLAVLRGLVERR